MELQVKMSLYQLVMTSILGRPRKFDFDAALDGALQIFWTQGYRGTNLPDLLTAMGLTRGSFYKAFGDKDSVYLAALDRYDTDYIGPVVRRLTACQAERPSQCLAPLFSPSDPPGRGCFICNAIVELAPTNPDVAMRTLKMSDRLRGGMASVVRRHRPDLSDAQCNERADTVLHLYFGHQAMSKAQVAQVDWAARLAEIVDP